MPRAIPLPIRQVIIGRLRDGATQAAVAAEVGRSPWTVRTIWRRYRDGGAAALVPSYARCGRRGLRASPLLYRAACWLRRRHPTWGRI